MFPRLPVTPAQVNSGNTCRNLLNEIRPIIEFFVLSEKNHEKNT